MNTTTSSRSLKLSPGHTVFFVVLFVPSTFYSIANTLPPLLWPVILKAHCLMFAIFLLQSVSMGSLVHLVQVRALSTSLVRWSARRKFVPRRALMYVPGNDERKVAKIPQLGADCICLDCEDGVSVHKKVEARQNIRQILDDNAIPFGQSECSVRVNSVASGLCEDDLKTVLGGQNLPSAIHLPKVDEPEQLIWFGQRLNESLSQTHAGAQIGLIIFIESARALIRLAEICEQASRLSTTSNLVPEALVFGSDDFVADIGATRTPKATELLYARQKLVTVAKAYQLQAIDLVHIDYKDLDGLRIQSEEGACMGFTGKQVIHPGQIPVVQAAFAPSPERIEWATELIKQFREHEARGKGAFNFRGSMIDMPLVKQAQHIVDMKDKL